MEQNVISSSDFESTKNFLKKFKKILTFDKWQLNFGHHLNGQNFWSHPSGSPMT